MIYLELFTASVAFGAACALFFLLVPSDGDFEAKAKKIGARAKVFRDSFK